MKISGNSLADPIREHIKREALALTQNAVYPHIAIITVGDEADWKAYVAQKIKWAEKLSLFASLHTLESSTEDELLKLIKKLNEDSFVHGIIVQRPLPKTISKEKIIEAIDPAKDVDGFRRDSPFEVPVWMAVRHILTYIANDYEHELVDFLRGKEVSILGKGETAGSPVIDGMREITSTVHVIDSKTTNPDAILQKSDIVISCVGKEVISRDTMHDGQILVGVGIRNENGKLKGDFDNLDAQEKNTIYTPTPGGVGPLNLTFLLQNLLQAAQFSRKNQV